MQKVLQSKLFIVFAVFILIFSGAALVREVFNTVQTKKEIIVLEKQSNRLAQHNRELKNLVEYLQSPEYHERVSREYLNLQKPGEVAVALPQVLGTVEEGSDVEEEGEPLPEQGFGLWWHYFFSPLRLYE